MFRQTGSITRRGPRLRGGRCAIISLVSLLPALAAAQAPQTARDDTIVVTGQKVTKEEARQLASSYARAVLALPASGQYARWKSPVCPRVIGLGEQAAKIVADKIHNEALAAGARVGKSRCKANLFVTFTDEPDAQIKVLLHKSGRLVDRLSASDQLQLSNSKRPVRWWYNARWEGANGHQMSGEPPMLLNAIVEGGSAPGVNSKGGDQYLDGYSTTLIGSRIRSNFETAFVVIDPNKAEGKTLAALAAYVAFVSLAEIRMDPVNNNVTILTLFDETRPVGDLTLVDRAFLKAVYSTPPNRDRREQAGAILASMTRALTRE